MKSGHISAWKTKILSYRKCQIKIPGVYRNVI